jgi:hypothetical protein
MVITHGLSPGAHARHNFGLQSSFNVRLPYGKNALTSLDLHSLFLDSTDFTPQKMIFIAATRYLNFKERLD